MASTAGITEAMKTLPVRTETGHIGLLFVTGDRRAAECLFALNQWARLFQWNFHTLGASSWSEFPFWLLQIPFWLLQLLYTPLSCKLAGPAPVYTFEPWNMCHLVDKACPRISTLTLPKAIFISCVTAVVSCICCVHNLGMWYNLLLLDLIFGCTWFTSALWAAMGCFHRLCFFC